MSPAPAIRTAVAALLAACALAGCGDGSSPGGASSTAGAHGSAPDARSTPGSGSRDGGSSTSARAPGPGPAAAARGRCVAAPQPLVAQILGKLRTTGAPVLRHAYAYRPRATAGVAFVAGVPGGSRDVAVWVTREGPGRTVVYAVNREARRASAWGTGGAVGRTLSAVPGAGRAAACARRAAG